MSATKRFAFFSNQEQGVRFRFGAKLGQGRQHGAAVPLFDYVCAKTSFWPDLSHFREAGESSTQYEIAKVRLEETSLVVILGRSLSMQVDT